MRKRLFILPLIFVATQAAFAISTELPTEAEVVLCQDQAESFGNGKGEDRISKKCIANFKTLAAASVFAVKESIPAKLKFFGYKNMVIIEKNLGKTIGTNLIAGNYTELKSVRALAYDEKHEEIAVLEESGDILFFSAKITGNVAPYRIIKNKELVGATDLVVDGVKDLVMVNNERSKKVLFLSRLANIHARKGQEKLNISKSIDTSMVEIKDLATDLPKLMAPLPK